MNDFHKPTSEEFDELVRDQRLDDLQARELRLVLYHVDEDLKEYRNRRKDRKPRRELVRRLKRAAKLLSDLEFELRRWGQTIDEFLPADTREEIGTLMSFSAMESALKREIQTPELSSEIESLSSECPDFRMAQLEDRLLTRRQARGLEHGGELLMHFVERINQPIKTWFDVDRLNRGGRPPKTVERDYLLLRLAEAAPAVIGKRPTATANGPFVRLCAAVVVACRLEDRGIERAVENTIKKLSSDQLTGFRRIRRPPATPPRTGSANL
jgi:hypothetical protein